MLTEKYYNVNNDIHKSIENNARLMYSDCGMLEKMQERIGYLERLTAHLFGFLAEFHDLSEEDINNDLLDY